MAPEGHIEHHNLKYRQTLFYEIILRFLLFYGAVAYRGNGLQFPEHLRWDCSHMLRTFGNLGLACSCNEKRRPPALNQQDSSSTWPTNIAWDGSIPPALTPQESQETLWSINIDHNRTQGRTGEMRERQNQRKRMKGGWGLLCSPFFPSHSCSGQPSSLQCTYGTQLLSPGSFKITAESFVFQLNSLKQLIGGIFNE